MEMKPLENPGPHGRPFFDLLYMFSFLTLKSNATFDTSAHHMQKNLLSTVALALLMCMSAK